MTLDEAIKHAEEVAEEKENEAQDLEYSKLDWKYEANQCSKCAEEHRQLAEWLKDYKRLLEQESCEDCISRNMALSEVKSGMIRTIDGENWKRVNDNVRDIRALPPAQPEIVRCKDCKHREVKNGFCKGRGWPMQLVPDDGFCEKGERRDESRRDGIKK